MFLIVFKTIIDNLKSFFQKEERLSQDPKQVPDAASEVLGESQASRPVVEKPLPKDSSPQNEVPTELPFSAKELQNALKEQAKPVVQDSQPTITTQEIHELESEYVSDDDLQAFEESMGQISHTPVNLSEHTPTPTSDPLKGGFFSSFEDFLTSGSLDKTHLDGDLLHKMRVFHQRKQEGKEPLLNKQSATDTLRRRLQELQSLEHEWERLYSASRDAERSMVHVEEVIDEKTQALRSLLSESDHLAHLSQEVSEDQAFVLANGVHVRSLGALLRAVRNEPWLYMRHVTTERNDFASWIESAVNDPLLAEKLHVTSTADAFLDILRSV